MPPAKATTVQQVADRTLDRADAFIRDNPGCSRAQLADAIGMAVSSIQGVAWHLRDLGLILPLGIIRATPAGASGQMQEALHQRVMRRARRGLVVTAELAEELASDPAELPQLSAEVAVVVAELRALGLVCEARGYWPVTAHHDPDGYLARRDARLRREEEADRLRWQGGGNAA